MAIMAIEVDPKNPDQNYNVLPGSKVKQRHPRSSRGQFAQKYRTAIKSDQTNP